MRKASSSEQLGPQTRRGKMWKRPRARKMLREEPALVVGGVHRSVQPRTGPDTFVVGFGFASPDLGSFLSLSLLRGKNLAICFSVFSAPPLALKYQMILSAVSSFPLPQRNIQNFDGASSTCSRMRLPVFELSSTTTFCFRLRCWPRH
jgi:hypothetical protein